MEECDIAFIPAAQTEWYQMQRDKFSNKAFPGVNDDPQAPKLVPVSEYSPDPPPPLDGAKAHAIMTSLFEAKKGRR